MKHRPFVVSCAVAIVATVGAASCSRSQDAPANPPASAPAPAAPPASSPATSPAPNPAQTPATTPPAARTDVPPASGRPAQTPASPADKSAAQPAELKIDSQVRVEIRRLRGQPAPPDATGVKLDDQKRALVDVRATPTDDLRKAVESAGGTIVSTSERDHSLIAWIPLLAIERVAADPQVRAVVPAAQPMLQSQVLLGREVELRVGQAVKIGDEPLTVRFEGVSGDSRCPADVTCVWAGDAVVRVLVSGAGPERAALELHTKDAPDLATPFSSYRVRLIKLLPVRRSNAAIPADQYVATVAVTRQDVQR